MTVDPLLSLLVGALGAALLGLLGAWIQARREHTRWIREQRLSAYLDYMREVELIRHTPDDLPADVLERRVANARAATSALRLLGPDSVYDAAFELTVKAIRWHGFASEPDANDRADSEAAFEDFKSARAATIAAARRELRIRG